MALQVVGAGIGRTGTHSLKLALEQLLGKPCYHMLEVFEHLDHVPVWHAALRGDQVDWEPVLANYAATVDWPAGGCWRPLAAANPDAVVLLSTRDDAESWWRSIDPTIFTAMRRGEAPDPAMAEWGAMVEDMLNGFDPHWSEHDAAVAAYERHNAAVRAEIPPSRLIEWRPQDGWEPICRALDLPVPDAPFPHVNTTADFRAMMGLDAVPAQPTPEQSTSAAGNPVTS
jgi:hypothetical protein